jgi:hypothetical protein
VLIFAAAREEGKYQLLGWFGRLDKGGAHDWVLDSEYRSEIENNQVFMKTSPTHEIARISNIW